MNTKNSSLMMIRLTKALLAMLYFLSPSKVLGQLECLEHRRIAEHESLRSIAQHIYKDSSYADAIWLATLVRARPENPDFSYIGDPEKLPDRANLCVPQIEEAKHLHEFSLALTASWLRPGWRMP
jgi:hypothetical protein